MDRKWMSSNNKKEKRREIYCAVEWCLASTIAKAPSKETNFTKKYIIFHLMMAIMFYKCVNSFSSCNASAHNTTFTQNDLYLRKMAMRKVKI